MDERQLAYERLIAPIESRLIGTIWGLVRDPADAQDALQDALTVIWRRWDRLQTHPNPEALVVRICVNAAYDAIRRRHRHLRRFETENVRLDPPDPAPSALQAHAGAEARLRVRRAIASLSRNQATAIVMHVVQNIPYKGVAEAMRCREVTVRKHVSRARAKLRTLLPDLVAAGPSQEKTHA
ncbi:MAG: RNA polymerase sigma factor [Vicinamibacterales bacterium]|nr:RNA polymerase sigma factor [Vicinamibacterales bacterium]